MRVFMSPYFRDEFDVHLKNMLIIPKGGNHAIYMRPDEWLPAQRRIFQVVCRNLRTFNRYMREVSMEERRFAKTAASVAKGNLATLSTKELLRHFCRFADAHLSFFIKPIWIPFPVEPLLSEEANAALVSWLKERGRMDEYNEIFGLVFSPEEKNAITRERESLLRLVIAKKSSLTRHANSFAFIPCYDFADTPWDLEHFKKEYSVEQHAHAKIELEELLAGFKERKKKFTRFLNELEKGRTRELVIMAKKMAFVKDERDDYRRLGTYLVRPLYEEIAHRADISLKECVNMLRTEIEAFLRDRTSPPKKQLTERTHGYVLLRKGGEILIFSGANAEKVIQRELGDKKEAEGGLVNGIVGSSGRAEGAVVIVKTKHDLRRVVDGSIMVAVTTHPDFVPAMRKCAAIVTDEGGITSHAAIVSRELGIPCIVGCGRATQVFHEGERIRVDAEKGTVKRLLS